MTGITRRQFGISGTVSALAAATGASRPTTEAAKTQSAGMSFPEGFVWGCATAAYQTEGAATEDGRGASIWDTFSHTPSKTLHGDTGDVADDSYHLYKEDVGLLRNLGVNAYRMSISWPRIFPEGKGQPNPKGMDHYDRVVDELLANKIAPYVTLFHWDLPQALSGGWESRDTSKAFADYAAFVTRRLSDRVHHFMTTNEFGNMSDTGYRYGLFAPGLRLPVGQANQVRHNVILAHGLAVQAIRSNAGSGVKVGLAQDPPTFIPIVETPEHIEAARRATRDASAYFLTAILEGKYPESYLEREGANAPRVEAGDMTAIASPLDFVGLNVYSGNYVRANDSAPGYSLLPKPGSYPHMVLSWLGLAPEAIYWAVRNVSELWKPAAILITENGCPSDDRLTASGRVEDTDRVMYLRNYLNQLHRATSEGYPVNGYFLWSLLDNFEWTSGYSVRFGIHYVDYKTLKRTPKLSASWYHEVISRNALV
jgi:beta-glucosidase